MPLLQLLERAKETEGLPHKAIIEELRRYIRDTPTYRVIAEIEALQDVALIRYLWEAGLPTELQRITFRRLGIKGY